MCNPWNQRPPWGDVYFRAVMCVNPPPPVPASQWRSDRHTDSRPDQCEEDGKYLWPCNLCGGLEGTRLKMLACRRSNHMRCLHNDVPCIKRGRIRLVKTRRLPADQVDWSCPCCPRDKPAHLPKLARTVKAASVAPQRYQTQEAKHHHLTQARLQQENKAKMSQQAQP